MQGFQASEHLYGFEASGYTILSLIITSFREKRDTALGVHGLLGDFVDLAEVVRAAECILEAKNCVICRVSLVLIWNAENLQRRSVVERRIK